MATLNEQTKAEYRRIAYYYYKEQLTQEEIARKMNTSRQRINRILKACTDLGIVEININGLDETNLELERKIRDMYGLKGVRIQGGPGTKTDITSVAVKAQDYIKKRINDGDVIGISRGRATKALVENWTRGDVQLKNVVVTHIEGNYSESNFQEGADLIVYKLAEVLGADAKVEPVPIIAASPEKTKDIAESIVGQDFYAMHKKVNIALMGIGVPGGQWNQMRSITEIEGYSIDWEKDVAGVCITHFFDKEGNIVNTPFSDRLLTISEDDFFNIWIRVGIAAGDDKVEAIRAALKGKFVNVLITDYNTAIQLI